MTLDAFQKQIWESKYQYKNETFKGFCERIGNTIFPEDEKRREELIEYIKNFEVLFGGRINANIGIEEGGLTLFNCYILSTSKYDMDSLEGILDLAKDYALTLKSEGGVGFCANFLRPSKTIIRKIGVSTPGSVKFLEVFDKISDVITSGSVDKCDSYQGIPTKSSIRKGATMVTLNVCHPDIEEFVAAKSVPNRLTKMNMSVLITDAFMYAVENDLDWDLWFPDINFEKYKAEWDGSFEKWAEKGYPFVVYKTVKARELWDLLLKNSFNRNEPGILFIDTIRRYNNLAYIKELEVNCCNPCVVKGTLVATDRGLYPVEKLKVGDTIQTTLGFNKIKDITTYENQDVYRVNFSDGFFQDVTKGHIFHTMKTGKEAKKVWVDTIRLSELGSDIFVRKGWYKAYPEVDNTLIRDDGLLIGLYLGDGGFSNYTCFNISTNSNEDNSYIEDLFTRVGGNVRIDKSEGNCNRYYLTDNNTYLIKLFDKLGIDPNGKSFDIKNLLNTNKDFILGLIDGLISSDGDVNIKGNCPQVRFTNTSDLLHELLKHLMLFVKADYKKYNNKKAGEISKIYGREVIRKKDCYTGVIDNDSILNFYNEVGFLSHNEKNELLKYVIKNYQLNGVRWKTKIKSVEFIGKAEVYDIFEETTDTWNHEGYISRGCAEVTSVTGKLNHNNKEITMGDVCDLGSVNVVKFYNVKTKKFDFDSFNKRVAIMVRALDSIIDISNYPLEQYRVSAELRRKIGVGLAGIGSLLMMMNMRYGSDESTVFLEKLYTEYMNTLYRESALLAKDKGPFELYSSKLLNCGYVSLGFLNDETIDLIKKHGLRNSALSAIAPNGTLSILAGNVSGGIEPVFSKEFYRWVRVESKKVDFDFPNISKGEWFETDYLKETTIGDEIVLLSKDEQYRVDKNTGLCERILVRDYGYKLAKEFGLTETAGAMELSIEEHLNVLRVCNKYIDLSTSKTINIPKETTFEEFKALYGKIYSYGIKGCTTYREGSSVAVLETQRKEKEKSVKVQQKEFLSAFKDQQNGDIVAHDIQLPEEYPALGYILKTEGKKFYLHVCFKDKACTKPFAIFVNTNAREDNVTTFNALEKLEEIALHKGLNPEFIEETKRKYSYQKNPVKICRMLGLLLRHNVDVYTIVKGLDDLEGATIGTFVFRIKKFLSQFVSSHDVEGMTCAECGEKTIVFSEGCFLCKQCGYSKCG